MTAVGYAITSKKTTRTIGIDPETGIAAVEFEHHPNDLQYGFVIEYRLSYLQPQVLDIGLPKSAARLTPLVEFNFEPITDRFGQRTFGAINPGFI
jgi:hypothetical protein